MAHAPEIRTEAYELYLLGNSPAEIAAELKRRHPRQKNPTAKTIEKWAYVPNAEGKTWSERRYEAEAAAQNAVTKDFVSAKTKLVAGMMKIQAKLQERALAQVEDAEYGSFSQEVFAFINATKAVDKMLDSKLAEEARRADAIDCLIEAVRRIVPGFEKMQPKIMAEFKRLVNQKAQPET